MKRHFEDDARETPGAAEGRERLACFLATLAGLRDRPRDDETTLLEQGAKALASRIPIHSFGMKGSGMIDATSNDKAP